MPPYADPRATADLSGDRVVAAIYEAVLRPEFYGDFMTLWEDHVLSQLDAGEDEGGAAARLGGAELEAHFRRAFDILERIGRDRPAPEVARFVQDHDDFSLLIRCDGRIDARSARAVEALGADGGLAALEERLTAGSAAQLRRLLSQCAAPGRPDRARGEAVVLRCDLEPRHLIARSHPVDTAAARLVVIEPLAVRWSGRTEALLARSFGLSPAELELVRHLMAGRSLRRIAERTGRSEHTVRNQSKSVLAKTGSPSQADLIRLVAVLCRDDATPGGAGAAGLGGRRTRLTAADGRGFDLYRFGAPDGRPVLFLHGMMDSLAALELHGGAFARRGLRVLAPVRAGYGGSDRLDRPDAAVEAGLAQADAIWAAEGLGAVPVIGHMAGAAHAHALAAHRSGRVAGIVAVAGAVPIRSLGQLGDMAKRQRVVAYTARLAPVLLPAILRAGIAQIDSEMVGDFAAALYPRGTRDHEVLTRPGVGEAICRAYRFSVAQGHHGFLGDAHLMVRDWSRHLAGPECPVQVLHGAEDPAVPVAWVRDLCAARAGARPTVVEGCGQLVFCARPELVLDAVEALLAAQESGAARRRA